MGRFFEPQCIFLEWTKRADFKVQTTFNYTDNVVRMYTVLVTVDYCVWCINISFLQSDTVKCRNLVLLKPHSETFYLAVLPQGPIWIL